MNNILFYTTIGITILLISYFVIANSQQVPDKEKSDDRMNSLKKVLISIFGNNWEFVMLLISIILIFVLVLLYVLSNKDNSINVGDKSGKLMSWSFLGLIFAFCLYVIIFFIKTVREKYKTPKEEDYYYNKKYQKETNEIIIFTVVSIFVAIGLYFLGKYLAKKYL
tara:strand:+ start:3070 stop:3567 length:498 start_codon:yes stop_codon:yes gene_type:complete